MIYVYLIVKEDVCLTQHYYLQVKGRDITEEERKMLEEEGVNIPYNVILTKVCWLGPLSDFLYDCRVCYCPNFAKKPAIWEY